MLKIPIVHADSVSKSLRLLLARGKILYFATIMDRNRDSANQSQNEDNFATFSLGLEFLNEAEKEKNNGNFAYYFAYSEQSLLILLTVFRVGFDAQFHRLCFKTIGSCFYLCTIELWSTWEVWRALKTLNSQELNCSRLSPRATLTQTSRVLHNSIVHAKA